MYTIGQLGRRFGLSRGTLLHYDAIGLLPPSGRSAANYRLYTEEDADRLARIASFREAGVPLKSIGPLLCETEQPPPGALAETLGERLEQINREIQGLRRQQNVIVRLLGEKSALRRIRVLDKAQWVGLLRATGLSEEDMWRWHREFERLSPEAHQDFLESLGISELEIRDIRQLSRDVEAQDGCLGEGCGLA
jgi:DNA-binding transcriptional MerR regulator